MAAASNPDHAHLGERHLHWHQHPNGKTETSPTHAHANIGAHMRISSITLCVTIALMVLSLSLHAQERDSIDVSALGPQVGELIPAFSLPDQNGTMQTLESIMGERGALILFHRSANW